jgi:hypothetical protein
MFLPGSPAHDFAAGREGNQGLADGVSDPSEDFNRQAIPLKNHRIIFARLYA